MSFGTSFLCACSITFMYLQMRVKNHVFTCKIYRFYGIVRNTVLSQIRDVRLDWRKERIYKILLVKACGNKDLEDHKDIIIWEIVFEFK